MNSGIYAIKNIVNGHCYVGSTGNLFERWKQHFRALKRHAHTNSYLQNAWNKYGNTSFVYEIVERCNPYLLIDRETYWIKVLRSHKDENGYNFSWIPMASRLGCKASPETIAKMKVSLSGKNHPNWHRKLSVEHVANMSKAMMGIRKPNSGVKKKYKIINPEGNVVEVFGLRKFCRDHKLIPSMLQRVANGKQREYKKWKSIYEVNTLPSCCKLSRAVIAVCDGKEYTFSSMMDAVRSKMFDKPIYQQNIILCCQNKCQSCGKIRGKKVKWNYDL